MVRGIFFIIAVFISNYGFSQKEYHNWYFGVHCGLTFNNGYPEPLPEGNNMRDGASISDSLGNLLFYTDTRVVYDRLNRPIPNGVGLYGNSPITQGTIIVKLPSSNHLYYLFNVYPISNFDSIPGSGFHYSVIDMNLNNGFGDIVAGKKNIPVYLPLTGYALNKITAVRHKNNRDVWIIVRSFPGNSFYSYLLTPEGLNTIGKISPSFFDLNHNNHNGQFFGELNISPDGTKFAAAYEEIKDVEYGSFNSETGILSPLVIFDPDTTCGHPQGDRVPVGLEFSPDSKLLYVIQGYAGTIEHNEYNKIHQFDVSIVDSVLIKQSEYIVGFGMSGGIQTGPDGKIYGGLFDDNTLSVINNPNEKGFFCNYSFRSVSLGTGNRKYLWGLPQMLQKYFSYINYTAACINQPTLFNPNIYPVPDSVYWNFGDASSGVNDTSTLINTSHVYHTPGDYPVTLISYWQGGRSDTSVKVISVLPAPFPNIGDSAFICKGDSVTFESDVFDSYLWSSGDTTRSITVADTGTYWVEVTNALGCLGRDTVRVEYFPAPVLGDSVLISPTACNGSTGAIRDLTITGVEPLSVWWLDSYDNLVNTALDIYNLPEGWYSLWATDGRGCTNFIQKYYVPDAGDVLIQSVDHQPSYCDKNNGTITITAVTGLGDMLAYSILQDEWLENEGNFTNLEPGEYVVKVRVIDSTGCQATWSDKIIINNEPGPIVTPTTEPEIDNSHNGTVTLTAEGFGDLTYILNGVVQDTGYFIGLAQGTYYYQVIDQNGCITADSIIVINIQGFILSAIAGSDTICFTQKLTIPVQVNNFNDVKAFKVSLRYDATRVTCTNYAGLNSQLTGLTVEVFPAIERIVAAWNGNNPVTLSGTDKLFDLVFTAQDTGFSQLAWDLAGQSWFEGVNGPINNVEYTIGQMQVNEPAGISLKHPAVCCEGGILTIAPTVTGTSPITYQWTMPDGSTDNRDMFIRFNAGQEYTGNYNIKVTDALGCEDSLLVNAQVIPLPKANFSATNPTHDTIPFEQTYQLEATQGYASYEWNTGEATYYINVTAEGEYSVTMKTTEGCEAIESVFMLNTFIPIKVPNAFTPNGDGLNDTFRPVVNAELVRQFSMCIYNRWGQRIFETTNPAEGWNGKDAPAGVYSWVISYSDMVGKGYTLTGNVSLVK